MFSTMGGGGGGRGVFSTMRVFDTVGVFSTVGDILTAMGCSVPPGGYHEDRGGYLEDRGGHSVPWGIS